MNVLCLSLVVSVFVIRYHVFFTSPITIYCKPHIDSNRRDNLTTSQVGGAHLRGLRISLNNTFSVGGRYAPIFACIYGLKPSEMPVLKIEM